MGSGQWAVGSMNANVDFKVAALPQHPAERLGLSVARSFNSLREATPRALLTFLFLLLTAHCSLASTDNWTRQHSGTMAWLHAVYFLDQNHGWVAGSGGTILETRDGGQTWRRLYSLTTDTLRDVYFADEQSGWLLCERDSLKLKTNDEARAYLLKTNDGGLSWRRVNIEGFDVNARLAHAIFAGAERSLVFGESGVVLATNDGGAHWTPRPLPTRHLLLGGALEGTHGWLVGAGATIVQTSDGGITWQRGTVRDGADARFTAASFVRNISGWAVGTAGRIFATRDGGRTWLEQQSNVDADLMDVKFIDAAEGWAVGSQGVLLHTTNGGALWSPESSGTTHALERLFFVDRNHGWAVGFGGAIIAYGPSPSEQAPKLKE